MSASILKRVDELEKRLQRLGKAFAESDAHLRYDAHQDREGLVPQIERRLDQLTQVLGENGLLLRPAAASGPFQRDPGDEIAQAFGPGNDAPKHACVNVTETPRSFEGQLSDVARALERSPDRGWSPTYLNGAEQAALALWLVRNRDRVLEALR